MAKNQNVCLTVAKMQADLDAYTALLEITPYSPTNENYILEAVKDSMDGMKAAQAAEVNAQNALGTARDAAAAARTAWEFHNAMLAVKEQVIAQYGKNSDQVQSLGLKKKSEYKTPVRRVKAA